MVSDTATNAANNSKSRVSKRHHLFAFSRSVVIGVCIVEMRTRQPVIVRGTAGVVVAGRRECWWTLDSTSWTIGMAIGVQAMLGVFLRPWGTC